MLKNMKMKTLKKDKNKYFILDYTFEQIDSNLERLKFNINGINFDKKNILWHKEQGKYHFQKLVAYLDTFNSYL